MHEDGRMLLGADYFSKRYGTPPLVLRANDRAGRIAGGEVALYVVDQGFGLPVVHKRVNEAVKDDCLARPHAARDQDVARKGPLGEH